METCHFNILDTENDFSYFERPNFMPKREGQNIFVLVMTNLFDKTLTLFKNAALLKTRRKYSNSLLI